MTPRYYNKLIKRHPDCSDPDHPGCPDCVEQDGDESEDDESEDDGK